MSKNKVTSSPSIVTRDTGKIASITEDNMYQAIVAISKRSRQIASKTKEELSAKLADFATSMDTLDEMFENREQIEISRYYEKLPKSTNIAIDEFIEEKLIIRKPGEEEEDANA
jgi:hypothetical protein